MKTKVNTYNSSDKIENYINPGDFLNFTQGFLDYVGFSGGVQTGVGPYRDAMNLAKHAFGVYLLLI